MKPREIEVHIEELILHGFEPANRWRIGDTLEKELRGLLLQKSLPATWLSSPVQIDAGTIQRLSLTKPASVGAQIAEAIHRGGVR